MFERLASKLDSISCKMILGETLKKRTWQIEQRRPDLSPREVEEMAKQEMLTSMRSEALDATSFHAVREWSKRFLSNMGI